MAAACNHAQFTAECHECVAGVPPPVAPRLARHCCHREDGQPCERCADLRAGEARLRAVSTIPALLAADDDFARYLDHERRRWADTADRHETNAAAQQHPAPERERYREHAKSARGRSEFYRVVLSLHTPTVAAEEKGGQSP